MTTPKRLALIGAGAIAADHCRAIAATPDLVLTRVVDRHAERARSLAAHYGAEASSNPEHLLTEDVDAVIICTPPRSHVDLAVAALRAGKAVLLEKPVALDLPAVDQLLAARTETAGTLLVGQTARFQPANREIFDAVSEGRIGHPRLVHVSWYTGHVWPGGWRSWQLDPGRSGGHVLHNGVHALDLVTWFVGDTPTLVFARPVNTWASDMPTPDSFHILVEFEHGAHAVIELSYGLRARGTFVRRVMLAGTDGSAVATTEDEEASFTTPIQPPAGITHAMENQYQHFRDVLLDQVPPSTTPEQIRAAISGAIAAQHSADTGRPVLVEGRS